MNISDYIQLAIAIIAGTAAVLTGINIIVTNKNINIQKEQWEFSQIPIFKVVKVQDFNDGKNVFILANHNHVYFRIQSVHFSDSRVKAEFQRYGKIETALNRGGNRSNEKEFEGFQVLLNSPIEESIRGCITLKGIDGLGKKFASKSENVVIDQGKVNNTYDLTNTYFGNL